MTQFELVILITVGVAATIALVVATIAEAGRSRAANVISQLRREFDEHAGRSIRERADIRLLKEGACKHDGKLSVLRQELDAHRDASINDRMDVRRINRKLCKHDGKLSVLRGPEAKFYVRCAECDREWVVAPKDLTTRQRRVALAQGYAIPKE